MDPRPDPDPLKTVLYQEIDRYNLLLKTMHASLNTIVKVSEGAASTSAELEDTILSLLQLKVPRTWAKTYPSLKPLGSWIVDLGARIEFYTSWIDGGLPKCWWLPALTYPTGFLTAILQVSSRANGVSIDALSYENPVLQTAQAETVEHAPKEGVYVSGLYLEGATWNFPGGFLEESRPMELVSWMPIIHFKPVEGKKKGGKGNYTCPIYMYPIRSGSRERPSYVVSIDLKGGRFSSEFWTKRGVAILLAVGM
jgi:dynein heavy chain